MNKVISFVESNYPLNNADSISNKLNLPSSQIYRTYLDSINPRQLKRISPSFLSLSLSCFFKRIKFASLSSPFKGFSSQIPNGFSQSATLLYLEDSKIPVLNLDIRHRDYLPNMITRFLSSNPYPHGCRLAPDALRNCEKPKQSE